MDKLFEVFPSEFGSRSSRKQAAGSLGGLGLLHLADDDDDGGDDDDKFPRSLGASARSHTGDDVVHVPIPCTCVDNLFGMGCKASGAKSCSAWLFPSREIVSRITAAVRGEARRCSCVYTYVRTYDSTLLNEGGRYSRFVETSLSEIGSSPQKGEREREREIYERQIEFCCFSRFWLQFWIINTRQCNFNRESVWSGIRFCWVKFIVYSL